MPSEEALCVSARVEHHRHAGGMEQYVSRPSPVNVRADVMGPCTVYPIKLKGVVRRISRVERGFQLPLRRRLQRVERNCQFCVLLQCAEVGGMGE